MRTVSKTFDWQVGKKWIIALIVILTLIGSRSDLYAKTRDLQFDHPLDVGGILFNGGFIQDRDGFFWIATQSGLVKYDGYDLKKYTSGAPGSISSDVVFSIYEDSDGILWCTTSNGLNRYDKNTDSFTVYKHDPDNPNSISHNVYNWANQTIAQDGDGNLWFGTQRGLNKFDKSAEFFTSYAHDPDNPESLGSDNILAVFIDAQNVLWVGTDDGLDKFDASAETFIHYGHEPNNDSSLSHNVVGAIFEDEKGRLWVGTRGGGLNRFEKETGSFTRYLNDKDNPDSISDNFVYSINEFERGEIWVAHGGDGIGLDILETGTGIFTHYKHDPSRPNSLSNDHVMNVYEDSTGIIWTVIFDGKLDKLDNESEKFKLYQHDPDNDNSVGDNVIFVVFEDEDGIMWIGSDTGGLDRYDPKTGTFAHYAHDPLDPNSLPDSYVIGILEDSDGNFWLMSDNLWLFDRELGKVVQVFPIEAEYGSTIIEDSENSDLLWIATSSGGLVKFEKHTQTSTNYTHDPNDPNSISNNVVCQIFQDREGMIWIPTYGGGLDKFDPNTGKVVIHYKHDPDDPTSIGSDTVNHVYQDSEGNIWVGVVGGGLNKLNADGTFTRYTEQNGFLANNVTNIIEDDNGFLWLGTKIGLVRFDPKTEATKLYTQSDGLQSNEFWEYPHLKTRDGQLWVYGANGANSFYPDALEDNPYIPPVVVTSLAQGGEKMNVGKAPERVREITLDWQHNYFEFEFVALNYTSPEKNQYKYMLKGVDKDWYDSGTRRFGRYTSLPPGDYVLRIIGSNNDGVWNEEGVSVSVTVTPPFWRTWWFIALCVAGALGVLVAIYQARIQRLRAERQAALAVQESEARLRQVVENMPVMLDALDANGNIVVWSRECERVTGYSVAEIVNNPRAMELLYPDAAYRERMLIAWAERGDDYYDWEWQITCKDGAVKTVAWANVSQRLPIPGWATWGIGVDVTERVQAEEELRHLRNYLANIIDSMPSVLVGVDLDGKVTQWNAEAERATGVSPEDAVGQPLARAFPRLAAEMERVREAMQTREARSDPRQARKQDGETRYEDVTVYPLIANGVEGAVIRVDDVTEQVRLDEMMVQSEKMLSVGGLAAGMAHEINNPLSGMMQTASVMANRLGRNIPANLRAAEAAGVSMDAVRAFMDARGIPRMLTAINESGRRVAGIVDNMLSFARRSDAQVSSHDVADLLDKAVELAATDYDLKKQYDFKMIEIVRDYEDNLPYVPCESAKIQQVLLNVLRNGAEAMQEVGADRLHPTEEPTFVLRTRYEKERGMVCIEIADNGPGMTESVRKRAFEPFFTTKPVGVGTGLGLSVSYFIVAENHGGEMDVVSEPGQGATFIIRLPVDKKGDEG